MNCPDIRKVLHFRAPASLTSYIQESGRAGRDNQASQAILFFSAKEFGVRKAKITKAASENELKKLEAMKGYCENSELCRRFCLLKHFDDLEKAKEECSILTKHECCDICLHCVNVTNVSRSYNTQRITLNRHSPKVLLIFLPVIPPFAKKH